MPFGVYTKVLVHQSAFICIEQGSCERAHIYTEAASRSCGRGCQCGTLIQLGPKWPTWFECLFPATCMGAVTNTPFLTLLPQCCAPDAIPPAMWLPLSTSPARLVAPRYVSSPAVTATCSCNYFLNGWVCNRNTFGTCQSGKCASTYAVRTAGIRYTVYLVCMEAPAVAGQHTMCRAPATGPG